MATLEVTVLAAKVAVGWPGGALSRVAALEVTVLAAKDRPQRVGRALSGGATVLAGEGSSAKGW